MASVNEAGVVAGATKLTEAAVNLETIAVGEEKGKGGHDKRGKHRILAEIKHLEQDAQSLQEELEELEKVDSVSTIYKELLLNIERMPDPLLPITNGPVEPPWDRWFEGPQDTQLGAGVVD